MRGLALALVFSTSLLTTTPAWANDDPWAGLEIVDDSDLGDLRGGFSFGGVDIGFGATITTYADGEVALQTELTWTDQGAIVEQSLGALGQTLESLTPEQRAAMGLDGIDTTGGVVIADAAGVTALVHNVTEGTLQSVIMNTATGRDLSQQIDVTITLPGFEHVQEALGLELFGMRLDSDLSSVLAGN